MTNGVQGSRELLAPRRDVWAFVSTAGRLSDWWPGIRGVQDHGSVWTLEGDERQGLGRHAPESRREDIAVEVSPPGVLHLHFARSGYDVTLALAETAPNRTTATLSIAVVERHETLAERAEELLVGLHPGPPDGALVEDVLERLYDLCQTGADA